ncbi:MAG: flagellar motor switch protein FliG [OM182 bacterium]|jgi:flagellar motor switch protein FliG|nr:flagellar motor switch protein FliG [Gammaproteobacteria bacterium]RPG22929.1 MAG: flagellar motor switch protein FliG [Gammaproteobacteria bacterium TMED57]RZO82912.1 MAG: flagellar motor switch protein FliG [OM182 bacterium]
MAEANANPDLDGAMSPELALEMESLKTTERAALLMVLLGEQQASEIVGYLNPREVQALGTAMVGVSDVSQEAVDQVLDEFIGELKKQTNLGIGLPDYIEGVLNRALGPERASSVLSRILPSSSSKGLEILSWMTPRAICDMIADEHPQVIAIILSVLEDETAADVLTFLPAAIRPQVIRRVALLDTVQPNAMAELESVMAKQFATSTTSSASVGGVKAAANIMGKTKLEIETSVMTDISGEDEDLAMRIQDNMFDFENLVDLDNRSIQILMRTLEQEQMAYALKAAPEPVVEKFMANMSQRAGAMFLDEMEQMGMVRVTDAEDAQRDIIRQARKLQDAGEIILASADGGGFV